MHFAAFAYVEESIFDPASYYQNNMSNRLSIGINNNAKKRGN